MFGNLSISSACLAFSALVPMTNSCICLPSLRAKFNKKVVDILQLGQGLAKTKAKGRGKAKAVEPAGLSGVDMTPKALQQKIHELEGQMMQHAQNLEFEEAAQIRDQLHQLRELFIAAS